MVRALRRLFFVALLALLVALPLRAKDDWLPITQDDLKYTDPSGASAVILYMQDFTDAPVETGGGRMKSNFSFSRSCYFRIKVLADEGKKYADVEIPYWHGYWRIEDLHARVVQPDGSITEFNGKVYDKTVVKYRVVKIQARTFTLPDVRVGSIIEYRYIIRWNDYIEDTTWGLQGPLWIKQAHFALRPYTGYANMPLRLSWIGINLPSGIQPTKGKDNLWTLDMTNVPPIPEERFAPPEEWTKMILRFDYSGDPDVVLEPDAFWQKKAKNWAEWAEKFLGSHKAVDAEVSTLVQPGGASEAKLRKLYARAQKIRNLSYERSKTEKESKQEKLKGNDNVDDVLKHDYGTARDINMLFIAMARSAGFDASFTAAASRREHVFFKNVLNTNQLPISLVRVKLDGKELFLDAGSPFCPFGLIDWAASDVDALILSKSGGEFGKTRAPLSSDAFLSRDANLTLADGNLEGTVQLTFRGLDALHWRLNERNNDVTGKNKDLEQELLKALPRGSKADLTGVAGWEDSDAPLVAHYKVSIPGAVTQTGKRLLVPEGLFQTNDVHPFRYSSRRLPVYFTFPFREEDNVTIQVPDGYLLEATPQAHAVTGWLGAYQRGATLEGNKLHLQRQMQIDQYFFMPEQYSAIRSFYDVVRAGDEETLVLRGQQ